ncbi:uncharacterized protein LOC110987806 isoform X2 [Acanthaster planci]|uniref:Uncharacterized protein LOC110987806 isoform X2 n=1 Tax=Acanthaster planci TaxID=133434 RepID=A0A8B7ZNX4_ACAPL|nr:uncharacterized protein LOC110987806 isoform X2 [Acanthaster planci]
MSSVVPLRHMASAVVVRTLLDHNERHSEECKTKAQDLITKLNMNLYTAVSKDLLELFVDSYPGRLPAFLLPVLAPPHLKVLNLKQCCLIEEDSQMEFRYLKKTLQSCSSLQALILDSCNLALPLLLCDVITQNAPQLVSVSVEECRGVSNEFVQKLLRGLPNLSHLNISICPEVTDNVFALTETQGLLEERTGTRDAASWGCNLKSVDLSGNQQLTSTCIRHLTELCGPRLRNLNVAATRMDCTILWFLSGYSLSTAVQLAAEANKANLDKDSSKGETLCQLITEFRLLQERLKNLQEEGSQRHQEIREAEGRKVLEKGDVHDDGDIATMVEDVGVLAAEKQEKMREAGAGCLENFQRIEEEKVTPEDEEDDEEMDEEDQRVQEKELSAHTGEKIQANCDKAWGFERQGFDLKEIALKIQENQGDRSGSLEVQRITSNKTDNENQKGSFEGSQNKKILHVQDGLGGNVGEMTDESVQQQDYGRNGLNLGGTRDAHGPDSEIGHFVKSVIEYSCQRLRHERDSQLCSHSLEQQRLGWNDAAKFEHSKTSPQKAGLLVRGSAQIELEEQCLHCKTLRGSYYEKGERLGDLEDSAGETGLVNEGAKNAILGSMPEDCPSNSVPVQPTDSLYTLTWPKLGNNSECYISDLEAARNQRLSKSSIEYSFNRDSLPTASFPDDACKTRPADSVNENDLKVLQDTCTLATGETLDEKKAAVCPWHRLYTPCLTALDMSIIDFDATLVMTCLKEFFVANTQLRKLTICWKELSDTMLEIIAAGGAELRSLCLVDCSSLTSFGVANLLSKCRNLQQLDLQGVCYIADAALMPVFMQGNTCNLHSLKLSETNISDSTLARIAKYLGEKITTLEISWCEEISDQGLAEIAKHCTALETLTLRQCSMPANTLMSLAWNCTGLVFLNMSGVENLTDGVAQAMMPNLRHLKNLDISWNSELAKWQRCKKLIKLKMTERTLLQRNGVEQLSSDEEYEDLFSPVRSTCYAPCLRTLELQYCDRVSDDLLAELVAICLGALSIIDYYGMQIKPKLLRWNTPDT